MDTNEHHSSSSCCKELQKFFLANAIIENKLRKEKKRSIRKIFKILFMTSALYELKKMHPHLAKTYTYFFLNIYVFYQLGYELSQYLTILEME